MHRILAITCVLGSAVLLGCAKSEPQTHTVLKPVADEVAHDHAAGDHCATCLDHHEEFKDLPIEFKLPPPGEPVFVDVVEPGWQKIIDREVGKLSEKDQKLARWQRFCPVMDRHLGMMGVPHKIDLDGESLFVCCECCQHELKKNASLMRQKLARYYATRDEFAAAAIAAGEQPMFDDKDLGAGWEKIIARDLGKLSEQDLPLARQQRFCPVMRNRLGKMGVPVKVQLGSGPVFICCQGCEEELREKQGELVPKVDAYKQTRAKAAPAGGSE